MSLRVLSRGLLAVAVLVALAGGAFAQATAPWAPFYAEVPKDGRIYVFSIGERYDSFQKSGGTEIGQVITRPGYGPNGETVVFDSENAINLYNFKPDRGRRMGRGAGGSHGDKMSLPQIVRSRKP